MTRVWTYFLCFIALFTPSKAVPQVKPLELILPTENEALLTKNYADFYMYTNRFFEGMQSKPWQGGKYGFVRNQKRTKEGILFTKFHEGIDIKPLHRDRRGEPLDKVGSIAPGVVVHTNSVSAQSSYGKYVVVQHDWGYGPFYSLYAHLMTVSVQKGQKVKAGSTLGRMGYTGNGLNRERSHLHLELNLFLNKKFPKWHDRYLPGENHHGVYNGLNLVGIDISALYTEQRANPRITIPQFLAKKKPYYKVVVPRKGTLELLQRYPWLQKKSSKKNFPSWEIALTASGIPLSINPCEKRVTSPTVTWVEYARTLHIYKTSGRLAGSGSRASLSRSGLRYIQLLTGDF